jgi:hypothetical protein
VLDDLIMLDAAPVAFLKADRAPDPAAAAAAVDDRDHDDPSKATAAAAGDAGLDIAAMLQVLTRGDGAAGIVDLDVLPGGGGAGGFGEPMLLPGLENYPSMPEAQAAADSNKPSSSAGEAAGPLPVGDADVLGDDNLDELFGSDHAENDDAAEFSSWLDL